MRDIRQIVADSVGNAGERKAKLRLELVAKVGSKTDNDDSDELFHGWDEGRKSIKD